MNNNPVGNNNQQGRAKAQNSPTNTPKSSPTTPRAQTGAPIDEESRFGPLHIFDRMIAFDEVEQWTEKARIVELLGPSSSDEKFANPINKLEALSNNLLKKITHSDQAKILLNLISGYPDVKDYEAFFNQHQTNFEYMMENATAFSSFLELLKTALTNTPIKLLQIIKNRDQATSLLRLIVVYPDVKDYDAFFEKYRLNFDYIMQNANCFCEWSKEGECKGLLPSGLTCLLTQFPLYLLEKIKNTHQARVLTQILLNKDCETFFKAHQEKIEFIMETPNAFPNMHEQLQGLILDKLPLKWVKKITNLKQTILLSNLLIVNEKIENFETFFNQYEEKLESIMQNTDSFSRIHPNLLNLILEKLPINWLKKITYIGHSLLCIRFISNNKDSKDCGEFFTQHEAKIECMMKSAGAFLSMDSTLLNTLLEHLPINWLLKITCPKETMLLACLIFGNEEKDYEAFFARYEKEIEHIRKHAEPFSQLLHTNSPTLLLQRIVTELSIEWLEKMMTPKQVETLCLFIQLNPKTENYGDLFDQYKDAFEYLMLIKNSEILDNLGIDYWNILLKKLPIDLIEKQISSETEHSDKIQRAVIISSIVCGNPETEDYGKFIDEYKENFNYIVENKKLFFRLEPLLTKLALTKITLHELKNLQVQTLLNAIHDDLTKSKKVLLGTPDQAIHSIILNPIKKLAENKDIDNIDPIAQQMVELLEVVARMLLDKKDISIISKFKQLNNILLSNNITEQSKFDAILQIFHPNGFLLDDNYKINIASITEEDPTMKEWNVLMQPNQESNEVTEQRWESAKCKLVSLAEHFDAEIKITPETKNPNTIPVVIKASDLVHNFSNLILQVKEAQTPSGANYIAQRVCTLVDYICTQDIDPNSKTYIGAKGTQHLKLLITLFARAGETCSDRAITLFEKVEIRVKLIKSPDYIFNILWNSFKRKMIETVFIDFKNQENIEKILLELNRFNKLLHLGTQSSMLYEETVKKEPLMVATFKLLETFNKDSIVNFFSIFPEIDELVGATQDLNQWTDHFQDLQDWAIPDTEHPSKITDEKIEAFRIFFAKKFPNEDFSTTEKLKEIIEKSGSSGAQYIVTWTNIYKDKEDPIHLNPQFKTNIEEKLFQKLEENGIICKR